MSSNVLGRVKWIKACILKQVSFFKALMSKSFKQLKHGLVLVHIK